MSEEKKQVFTVEMKSLKPYSGKVTDMATGESAEFQTAGVQIDFIVKHCGGTAKSDGSVNIPVELESKKESGAEVCTASPAVAAEPSKIDESELKLVNDVKMPKREDIKEELMKVSNFTEDELSILDWSSMYKAYSLIVRYGQKGVEEQFRSQKWFEKTMKKVAKEKKRKGDDGKDDKKKKKGEKKERKEEKRRRREEKKKRREEKKREKEE